MTFLIGVAVFLVWGFFWVRGVFWMALPVPIFMVIGNYREHILGDIPVDPERIFWQAAFSGCFFIPYAIRRYREHRTDQRLNGVRFNYRD